MHVEITHHIDCDKENADGLHEWHYEYDLFRFSEGTFTLVARSYTDTPEEAHFIRLEKEGQRVSLTETALQTPLAEEATRHLQSLRKAKVNWLSPTGYFPVSVATPT